MPQDVFKPKGQIKEAKPDAGGAPVRYAPVLGVVKDNVDPIRAGRIYVYLSDNSGLDPNNRDNWRLVSYMSPYFGKTIGDSGGDTYGTYKGNPSSYGMWMSPPEIGSTVVCLFINGDLNYGFYIGVIPDPDALHMVPAIGSSDNILTNSGEANSYGGAVRLPVTNLNSNNENISNDPNFLKAPKPVHSYSAAIMNQQGVIRDPIRGPISSSAQRETPSRVGWGVSTPGRPIYEGGYTDESIAKNLDEKKAKSLRVVSRRGGHTIVMDDGDIIGRDQLIRIRTALGHQILMSDDGQTLMILHSNGQSYIELGKEGTIDMYATNSVNIRTLGDLNLHADRDVNIHATGDLNLKGENIHIGTEKEYRLKIGSDYLSAITGKHTTLVGGPMSMQASGDISMASSALAYVNGSKVNLNSGNTGTKPQDVKPIPITLHTDTLYDSSKGFLAAPGKLASITSRAPAHYPWVNAGQGVDVKTSLSASSNLPSSPNSGLAQTNSLAGTNVTNAVTVPSAAVQPSTNAVSDAIDKQSTGAILGAMSQGASLGPARDAVAQGAGIIKKPGGG